MTRSRRARGALLLAAVLACAGGVPAAAGVQQQPPAQDEFVPLDEVPPEDQLPAAPLLVTAYACVWLIVIGYLWSISRRQSRLAKELSEFSRRVRE